MDKNAKHAEHFPKWFMTAISAFGLGFQLLIICFKKVSFLNGLHLKGQLDLFNLFIALMILLT